MITKPKASVEESSEDNPRALFVIDYIEMDESEMMDSTVSDEVLYLVGSLLGPDVKDKLLYPVVEDVRLHNRNMPSAI